VCRAAFDVLNLLPDLLDNNLQVHGFLRGLGLNRLCTERVCFPVEFLGEEVQSPAVGAGVVQIASGLLDMNAQSVEFFGDVGPLGKQRNLLLQTTRVNLGGEFAQPVCEFRLNFETDIGGEGFDFAHDGVDIVQALDDRGIEPRAFSASVRDELCQCFFEQVADLSTQRLVVKAGVIADDSRPAEQVHRVGRADFRCVAADLFQHSQNL
jgi:hypothetical protein